MEIVWNFFGTLSWRLKMRAQRLFEDLSGQSDLTLNGRVIVELTAIYYGVYIERNTSKL